MSLTILRNRDILCVMIKQLWPLITVDQNIRFGKPVIAGTRVPVELIVGKIAGGMTVGTLAKEYRLTKTQILAALKYAADVVAGEEVAIA